MGIGLYFVVLFLFYKIFFEFFLIINATKYDPIISVYIAPSNNAPSKIGPDEYLRVSEIIVI